MDTLISKQILSLLKAPIWMASIVVLTFWIANRVYAKSWLPYSGNTNEPASYDGWIIDICDYPGSRVSLMIQSEYSSKYDFKGKLMVEHVQKKKTNFAGKTDG